MNDEKIPDAVKAKATADAGWSDCPFCGGYVYCTLCGAAHRPCQWNVRVAYFLPARAQPAAQAANGGPPSGLRPSAHQGALATTAEMVHEWHHKHRLMEMERDQARRDRDLAQHEKHAAQATAERLRQELMMLHAAILHAVSYIESGGDQATALHMLTKHREHALVALGAASDSAKDKETGNGR